MDAVKELFETLRTNAYTTLSLLLPGIVIFELLRPVLPGALPTLNVSWILWLILSYVIGLVAQGSGSQLVALLRHQGGLASGSTTQQPLLPAVRELVQNRLGVAVPDEGLLDVCLSHIGDRREAFDRFTALRDMSRGLLVASLVALVRLLAYGGALFEERRWLWLLGTVVAAAGLWDRYRRYEPLATQAAFGQFVAAQFKKLET